MKSKISLSLFAFLIAVAWPIAFSNCRAENDFRIFIVGQAQGTRIGLRGSESSIPLIMGTSKTLSDLASDAQIDYIDLGRCFFVVIENLKDTPRQIEMFESGWHDCLSFTLVNDDNGAEITRMDHRHWKKNINEVFVAPKRKTTMCRRRMNCSMCLTSGSALTA